METPDPGETRPKLDRPPSERYGSAGPEPAAGVPDKARTAEPRDRSLRAVSVGLGGALVITVLGGPLSVTAGLLAVAAVIGWASGSVLRPALWPAVLTAVGSVVLGLVGVWLFAGLEGGVLSLPAYLADVEGILAPLAVAVAAIAAAVTVR
jgi:hypothetical protein